MLEKQSVERKVQGAILKLVSQLHIKNFSTATDRPGMIIDGNMALARKIPNERYILFIAPPSLPWSGNMIGEGNHWQFIERC